LRGRQGHTPQKARSVKLHTTKADVLNRFPDAIVLHAGEGRSKSDMELQSVKTECSRTPSRGLKSSSAKCRQTTLEQAWQRSPHGQETSREAGRRGSPLRAKTAPRFRGVLSSGWCVLKNAEHRLDSKAAKTEFLAEKEPNQFPQRAVFTPSEQLQRSRAAAYSFMSLEGTQQGYEVGLLNSDGDRRDPYNVGPVGDPWGMRPGGGSIEAWDHMNQKYLKGMADLGKSSTMEGSFTFAHGWNDAARYDHVCSSMFACIRALLDSSDFRY